MAEEAEAMETEAMETEEKMRNALDNPEGHIHFGTIDKTGASAFDGLAEGIAAGNIHRQSESTETMELSEASAAARERHEALLAEFEKKRRARTATVPTDDAEVRKMLRGLKEPVTLFGEKQMERRDRLRQLLAGLDAEDGGELPAPEGGEVLNEVPAEPELFYTEGTGDLMRKRTEVLQSSLQMAADRLARFKRRRENPDEDEVAECKEACKAASTLAVECSEIADERPMSSCAFSPDGSELVTASWSGLCKFWTVEGAQKRLMIRAHDERVTGVCFHPNAGTDENNPAYVATGSADHTARLWSREGKLLETFKGHTDRLARLAFHPRLPGMMATASFDHTWRLWDVATATEVLLQEGHSRPVYDVAFHPDGSLAGSVGLDTHVRVWDLRVGRNILTFSGHVKQVLAVSFSPNGYHMATGGGDHTCKIWDLRKKQLLHSIPAHSNLLSQVRYEPEDGHFLLTASYDHTAKVWSGHDFKRVTTLSGHEEKVMGADIMRGGETIATVSYDRTVKLWKQDQTMQAVGDEMLLA